jgi:exopolysaccharide production protein ExoY
MTGLNVDAAKSINRHRDKEKEVQMAGMSGPIQMAKRMVDIVIALVFIIGFAWLYVLVAFGVLASSGSPVFYSQKRLGKNGREFKLYKFRSMVADAANVLDEYLEKNPHEIDQWASFQKLENDPRVTRFGKFIRRTSIDELPQFWNVLVGDMSVVGPRPCMVQQKELYSAYWSHYCAVRPGITGLWQVSGRNHLSFEERVRLDVRYVQSLSVMGDAKIFFRTVFVVLTGHGSR